MASNITKDHKKSHKTNTQACKQLHVKYLTKHGAKGVKWDERAWQSKVTVANTNNKYHPQYGTSLKDHNQNT